MTYEFSRPEWEILTRIREEILTQILAQTPDKASLYNTYQDFELLLREVGERNELKQEVEQ